MQTFLHPENGKERKQNNTNKGKTKKSIPSKRKVTRTICAKAPPTKVITCQPLKA